jgi:hypothetical protein
MPGPGRPICRPPSYAVRKQARLEARRAGHLAPPEKDPRVKPEGDE